MYEILRYYDALDLTLHHKVVVPSNWGQVSDSLNCFISLYLFIADIYRFIVLFALNDN